MKTRLKLFTLFVVVACLFSASPLSISAATILAQTNVGRVSGTITDSSGGAIQGVVVKVTNDATGVSRTITPDENGSDVVTNLSPGSYTVSAEQQGFKKGLQTGYTLVADGRLTVNFDVKFGVSISQPVNTLAAACTSASV